MCVKKSDEMEKIQVLGPVSGLSYQVIPDVKKNEPGGGNSGSGLID